MSGSVRSKLDHSGAVQSVEWVPGEGFSSLVTASRLLQASWSFRHLVNLTRIRQYNEVNGRTEYTGVDIRSRLELENAE